MAVQADWLEKDFYAVLGVAEDADTKTISRAYRTLARELHPDTHPDDADASERFKDVNAAYDVIGDEAKRAEYDEFRRAVADANAPSRGRSSGWTDFDASARTADEPDDLEDLLRDLFNRTGRAGWRSADIPRRGADLEAVLDLSFEDAVRGLTTDVTVTGPDGPRTFKVRVPAGVDDGQRIRLPGKGGGGSNGGPAGDLYAVVRVAPHPVFGRRGRDLTVDATIGWPQAALGTEIEVPTLDGRSVRVRVPAGTPHGRILRVRGHGVPTATGAGDLLARVQLTVPSHLTDDQRRAVEAVAAAFDHAT